MSSVNEFKILQKVQDMMSYGYPMLRQFPKSEKFSLAQDIRDSMNQLLRYTVTEEKKHSKKTTAENMDVENGVLQSYIRIANQLGLLSNHAYGVWSAKLVEIGKMIGGLLKSVNGRPLS